MPIIALHSLAWSRVTGGLDFDLTMDAIGIAALMARWRLKIDSGIGLRCNDGASTEQSTTGTPVIRSQHGTMGQWKRSGASKSGAHIKC